ncbi:hypothetical protein GWK47_022441 [Chionoecetes opilio]|uniref:Uncharacterized protein n=1 Tax=Chionoecetes opilio TaxID=41210 RepID=A0A8J4XMU7_CHIOP|nr:hypothetical protein GWK47_022441 [Chionoecetes opilio]
MQGGGVKVVDVVRHSNPTRTPLPSPRFTSKGGSRLPRLRLGYRCASQIQQTAPDQGPYCFEIEDDPLHHYILRCPVTQALRHHVAWIPYTDNEAAALAIASASTQLLANLCSRYPPP